MDDSEQIRPAKRARVALACQRCKYRKQKCDGVHPTCSKCKSLQATCEYILPSKPMPFGKNHYLKALEARVAELESYLSKEGLSEVGTDHWQYLQRPGGLDDGCAPSVEADARQPQRRDAAGHADGCSGSDDNEEPHDWQTGVESMVDVLRELSLEANGGYIGASSHITMGRLVGSIVKGEESTKTTSTRGNIQEHLSPKAFNNRDDQEIVVPGFTHLSIDVADRLLVGYVKHTSTRFPVLHFPWVRDLHLRRNTIEDVFEKSSLHLVYAIAGRFLETTGEVGIFFPEKQQAAALTYLDEILSFHDIRSVQTLMLLAIYCLRAPKGPGAWTYVRLAIQIGIDLGLHRRTPAMNQHCIKNETRKRLFWSCYNLDRQVSIPLGRPFAICDRDIDVPLPLDVDEETQDNILLEQASNLNPSEAPGTSTTLSLFLQVTRLRRIESNIQQSIYRVDTSVAVSDTEIDAFIAQLLEWKSLIPLDARKKLDSELGAFDGYDHYMVFYYKCLRLLLYPQILRPHVNPRFLKQCAEVCGGLCQTYKRLHQSMSVGYSLMALQTVFMAGLTLIYCAWSDPTGIFNTTTSNDINACSIVLFVITERWPGAKRYRDAFEVVKQSVVDLIAAGKHQQPRKAIMELKSGLESTLQDVQMNEGGLDEFSRIMTEMAGERIAVEQGEHATHLVNEQATGYSPFQNRSGYMLFPTAATPDYQEYNFDHVINAGLELTDAQFPAGNTFAVEFEVGSIPEWRGR
ncbi:putative transcriptional regulatory protein [Lachnellula occidentalis]|uniref:Putative transcriptional regulatory protein n=1 Tax=Lachnellula occidentalis TaxID=215460 RepID=A0A8H8UJH1_9HELO|nr:putative transcriptional regulatory protein [Lachnellula occidentalis]